MEMQLKIYNNNNNDDRPNTFIIIIIIIKDILLCPIKVKQLLYTGIYSDSQYKSYMYI